MHDLSGGIAYCPECGRAYGSVHAEPFALKPGTILNGKYLMGEMLGQGGFGITYIGLDLLLQQKVAIKEYFPTCTGMVSRENRSTVVWSSAMVGKTGTQRGFDSFLKEARKMAKLGGIPNVVGVKSVFTQNETAYIVMDFIEGETLQQKMQKNGPMDFDSCIRLMTPIMQSLAEVHKHGIIHRDISPDNIMVQPDGKPVLLDLGAAKDLDIQGKDGSIQTTQMVAKQGFSPIEQYRKNASVGPWTDVYSIPAAAVVVLVLCIFISAMKTSSAKTYVMEQAPHRYSNAYIWGQTKYLRENVYTLTFLSTLENAPSNAWDVSEAGDGSVLAWMVSGNLCIAANGKIAPNSDASYTFAYFTNLKKIDFGDCFDTSNVTDMSCMFVNCSSLTELDLSSFNTSKLINMSNMFSGCDALKNLVYSDSRILEVCRSR